MVRGHVHCPNVGGAASGHAETQLGHITSVEEINTRSITHFLV